MTTPSEQAVQAEQQRVPTGGAFCAACGSKLVGSANFCHRCGQPVGQAVPPLRVASGASSKPINMAAVMPWAIATIALLVIVAVFAGRGSTPTAAIDTTGASALGTAPSDPGNAGATPPTDAPATAAPAPSIANMSPSERARRLYERLMRYADQGKADSIAFFAPMALASHSLLETPTPDERYHFGRVAEVTGHADVAAAQADTILKQRNTSLLGLVLASEAARMSGNEAAAKGFDQRLLKALDSELARKSPEDAEHRADIDRAVADARKGK